MMPMSVLVGVSRTSKTPTCLYLANRGIKAANVPFVPGVPLPPELINAKRPLIVGLTNDPERLIQVRRNRLSMLHHDETTDYTDIEAVRAEVREARRVFAERHWPVIDVTRRSIEETAAAILSCWRGVMASPNDLTLVRARIRLACRSDGLADRRRARYCVMKITGAARLAGIMGWPVAHSRSPVLHGFWLDEHGIDGAYVPLAGAARTTRAGIAGAARAGFSRLQPDDPAQAGGAQGGRSGRSVGAAASAR